MIKNQVEQWEKLAEAYDLIKYWTTLTPKQYLEEDEELRKKTLQLVFMNWKKKPSFCEEFKKKIIEPIWRKQKEDEDLKSVKWLQENWEKWQLIWYTNKFIFCAKEEATQDNKFRYKSWFIIDIKEKPLSAKTAIKYITYTSDNPKYDKLFETEKFNKFKEYINNLDINYDPNEKH